MNIFTIEIGRISRRGNFERLYQKVVSVPESCRLPAVKNYFEKKYEGFDVRVSHTEEVTELSELTVMGKDKNPQELYLHFQVEYTEKEKELHKEYRDNQLKADQALLYLHSSIEDRYRKLYYSGICNMRHMELRTDSFSTYCDKFPINGVFFETAAQKAEEGFVPYPVPEPEPSPEEGIILEGEELPDDMPF